MKRTRVTSFVIGALACTALLAACGGKSGSNSAADDSTTTKGPDKTTTTATPPPAAILTGLPLADPTLQNRPLLTVKVDNHPQARPQFGIDRADVIVEEKVEGGLSRFMALFQSEDVDKVGPVRSLRSTDAKWLKPEGGMIAYSGGIQPFKNLLAPNGITDLGGDNHGETYYKRRGDRPYEHSLYTNTNVLRTLTPANAKGPKPLFGFLQQGEAFGGDGVAPVASVSLSMGQGGEATYFDWTWNAEKGMFVRGTEGKAHDIEGQGQIAMKNVIVQFTSYSTTPWKDRANSPVDEANVVGNGDAWFLADGKIVKGKWSRASADVVTSYTDVTGKEMKFEPGHSWISLVPPGQPNEIR
jgi:hypothetical protein